MPEIKNTFVKSKMNKDLDSRLIPNGEYRDGLNISVSTSEGSDVGALENIRGNFELSNFGLTDFNLEVIGSFVDTANNRIYFFITNFVDGSGNQLDNRPAEDGTFTDPGTGDTFERKGAKNCIAYCEIPYLEDLQLNQSSIISDILVEGAFLNFSKTHPINGVNLVENLLFFTDNRNQPRKINVETAISNPLTYYTTEDDISVAKFAPYKPISFLDHDGNSTLKNEVDEWLPAFFISPGEVYQPQNQTPVLLFDGGEFGPPTSLSEYASPALHIGGLDPATPGNSVNPTFDVRVYRLNDENRNYAYVRTISTGVDGNNNPQDNVSLEDSLGNVITDIKDGLGWEDGTFAFEIRNPHYRSTFSGDKEFLKDKFVKFSYRFKYDDGEYSILAPFSQHAFIPKQYGYFIGVDDNKTKESSIVDFMENQVSTAGLTLDLPYSISEIGAESGKKLKIKEVQLLYKSSDERSLKVIADLKIANIQGVVSEVSIFVSGDAYSNDTDVTTTNVTGSGSGLTVDITVDGQGTVVTAEVSNPGSGYQIGDIVEIAAAPGGSGKAARFVISKYSSKFIYNYESQKPIKVLDEKEITRVNDITPIRALSQEAVGNRIVYGNFLQNNETPNSLNYKIIKTNKGADTKKEYLNHSLKQGRTYQVGIVLQDRYGRSSNVITNDNGGNTVNSTFYSEYTDGGVDPLSWPGDALQAQFFEKISENKTDKYNGVYDEKTNPLGWYTYKIVVKQQEQDYYNIYVPGCLSGNVNFTKLDTPLTYTETESISHIALFNDNINKLPRDLKEVGPSDTIYGSSVILYNRVKNSFKGEINLITPDDNVPDINDQNLETPKIEVITIKPFRDFGDWTTKKNVNIKYTEAIFDPNAGTDGELVGPYDPLGPDKYIYPGVAGGVDPLFLKNNKNPLIATLSVTEGSRLGYSSENQDDFDFAKKLMVFETKPVKSALDIYYETSSTGLVKDFNEAVDYPVGLNGQPVDLTDFIYVWQENVNVTDVTNVFQTIDSNGNPLVGGINAGNPSVQIDEVLQRQVDGTYATASNIFDLETVDIATSNTSATYKLVTNGSVVFDVDSNRTGDYKVNFKLTVDGGQDVIVQKSVKLSNVTPITLGVQTPKGTQHRPLGFNYFIYDRYLLRPWSEGEIQAAFSAAQNDQYWTDNNLPAPLDANGQVVADETMVNWRVVCKNQMQSLKQDSGNDRYEAAIFCPSHTSNGSAILPTPLNAGNRNNNAPPSSGFVAPEDRVVGINYSIKQVRRWGIYYHEGLGYWRVIGDQTPTDKTNDFVMKFHTWNGIGGIYEIGNGTVVFNPSGTLQNRDFPSEAGAPDGAFDVAYAYVITLKTTDASGGVDKKSSESNFIFIVTKDYFEIPDLDDGFR